MKVDAKRGGQCVIKGEQRGMFKISSRTKIKPKDDVICRIGQSISQARRSQSLNQPDSTQRQPCLPSYAPNSHFSVCVSGRLSVCVGERETERRRDTQAERERGSVCGQCLSERLRGRVDGSVREGRGRALPRHRCSAGTLAQHKINVREGRGGK